MNNTEKVRIDKYLWAIRIFKTRNLATEACKGGKIKLKGQNIKPSYEVKTNDTYSIQKERKKIIIKVTGILEKRMDAKTAVLYYENLTPEKDPIHNPIFTNFIREKGSGRPTKKDRRDLDNLLEF